MRAAAVRSDRDRPRRGATVATTLAFVVIAASVLGCGGTASKGRSGHSDASGRGVVWAGRPQLFRPRTLPSDRVILGRIRNVGGRTLALHAADVAVRDARGRRIPGATAAFTASYAHGLFGALQQPSRLPLAEEVRLGRLIDLLPGATVPFYVAWHLPAGVREPVTIIVGRSTLSEPPEAPSPTA